MLGGFKLPDVVRDGALLEADQTVGKRVKRADVVALAARVSLLLAVVECIANRIVVPMTILEDAVRDAASGEEPATLPMVPLPAQVSNDYPKGA